jgi:microcystin-dependent protein
MQSEDVFVAEIRLFPYNFAPVGWAFCDGQLLPISQNTALFSLLGTTFGGNGQTTFALPDMRGATPLAPGQGPGLSLYSLGQMGGVESVSLVPSEIPVHTHTVMVQDGAATTGTPSGGVALAIANVNTYGALVNLMPMGGELGVAGGGLPHNNRQPFLGLMFCIALQGIFPSRN